MSCPTGNAPIDLVLPVSQPCNSMCGFTYDYDTASCSVTNNTTYLDSTSKYLDKASQFFNEQKSDFSKRQRRQLLQLTSDFFFFKRDFPSALAYYDETMELTKSLHLKKRIYQIQFRQAECYFYLKKYDEAKALFDQLSIEDLDQYKLLENKINLNYYYAILYSKLEDDKNSQRYIDSFRVQSKQFHKDMSSIKIDAATQNGLEQRDAILKRLEESNARNAMLKLYGWILLIVFVSTVAFLILYIKKQRKQAHTKIKSLVEKLNGKKEKISPSIKVEESKAQKILEKLIQVEKEELFLLQNYSLNMVAKKVESNSSYVSQIVNTYWKKSFVQYTNELRINYILIKLKEDAIYQKFTLFAIAESAGYKSLSSFNKHFKAISGVSPKQYLQYLKTN